MATLTLPTRKEAPSRNGGATPTTSKKKYRIATYARVSNADPKDSQGREHSLVEQEERFQAFLAAHPTVVRVPGGEYSEAVSAKSIEGREQFLQMCDEVCTLDVECVVVDSLDRYTREMFGGTAQVVALWKSGVDLWELEYAQDEDGNPIPERDRPFDQHNDTDRDYIWKKFADAEAERRRIRKRQVKSVAIKRSRKASVTNRPGFGLVLYPPVDHTVAKDPNACNRQVIADPDPLKQQICREVDEHFLAGWSTRRILDWLHATYPKAGMWKSRRGLTQYLRDEPITIRRKGKRDNKTGQRINGTGKVLRQTEAGHYVRSGLRSSGDQAKIRELLKGRTYGADRPTDNQHELSGLIACGHCVDVLDKQPENARMHGRMANGKEALACERHRPNFYVTADRVLELWEPYFDELADAAVARKVVKLWKEQPLKDAATKQRRVIESEISKLQQRMAQLDRDRNAAVRLAGSDKPGVVKEAEAALEQVVAQRAEVQAEISKQERALLELPTNANRDPQAALLTHLIEQVGWGASIKTDKTGRFDDSEYKRVLAEYRKPFVRALGFPIVHRPDRETKGWRKNNSYKLTWPEMDKLLKQVAK
jgi:DNA invertase Pin-like site-specific DNA recombinase